MNGIRNVLSWRFNNSLTSGSETSAAFTAGAGEVRDLRKVIKMITLSINVEHQILKGSLRLNI